MATESVAIRKDVNAADLEAANTAYCELAGLLDVLRAAYGSSDPPSGDAAQTIVELALDRANTIGGFIGDLGRD